MPTVRIPTPLRKLTQGKEEVAAAGATIGEVFANLEDTFPGFREKICDESGNLRRFVNVFVRQEDIRFLEKLDTPVADSDEISIVPAIAGGANLHDAEMITRGKYYLTFPDNLVGEEVICDMFERIGVRFSIRQADVSDDYAVLGVELTGSEDRVRRAEDYLESRGVRVDRIRLAPA